MAPGPEALGQRVAALVLEALRPAPAGGPAKPLGLATGRTMEPVYGALVEQVGALPSRERQDLLAGWSSFNLDEYVGLGPGDPESFAASMERFLGAPLGLAPGQLRLPDGLAPHPEREARRYGQAIAAAGGLGLQLLGLGDNGHGGFNEPPCAAAAEGAGGWGGGQSPGCGRDLMGLASLWELSLNRGSSSTGATP